MKKRTKNVRDYDMYYMCETVSKCYLYYGYTNVCRRSEYRDSSKNLKKNVCISCVVLTLFIENKKEYSLILGPSELTVKIERFIVTPNQGIEVVLKYLHSRL